MPFLNGLGCVWYETGSDGEVLVALEKLNITDLAVLSWKPFLINLEQEMYSVSRLVVGVGRKNINDIPLPLINATIIAHTMIEVHPCVGVIIGHHKTNTVVGAGSQSF